MGSYGGRHYRPRSISLVGYNEKFILTSVGEIVDYRTFIFPVVCVPLGAVIYKSEAQFELFSRRESLGIALYNPLSVFWQNIFIIGKGIAGEFFYPK